MDRRFWRRNRLLRLAIPVAILLAAVVAASFLVDEPLRRRIVGEMNRRLEGYVIDVRSVDFHPIGFSIDLIGLRVSQSGQPGPPVLSLERLEAGIHWKELLVARLVADFRLVRPRVHVNLPQLRKEARDPTPVAERGWQDALQAAYPLKINLLRIEDGDFLYVDKDPKRPLHMSRITLRAENIRNIRVPDRIYPSEVHAGGVIFGSGRFEIDGRANFLAEPFPGIRTFLVLDNVGLGHLEPVLSRYNLDVKGGVLSAGGEMEYAPTIRVFHLRRVAVRDVEADYVHTAATAAAEKRRREKVKEAAEEVSNKPGTFLGVDELTVRGGYLGYVNRGADPAYRVFLDNVSLSVSNLSNQEREGTSTVSLRGSFMGSGNTAVSATFRPEKNGPDFDLAVRIEGTRMRDMNDLFRAYGNFDVVGGRFSLYSEVGIRGDSITGYVKPLFRDLKAYDRRQDREKNLFRKLYEKLVGGIAGLLENRQRDEVATKTDISGTIENPRSSTMQILVRLIQNAFFRAILPGFDDELGRPNTTGRGRPRDTGRNGARRARVRAAGPNLPLAKRHLQGEKAEQPRSGRSYRGP